MRILADRSSHKLNLFGDLVSECQLSAPGYRLSDKLRRKMEEFGREDRREVACQKTTEGCAPLFLACRNGSADVVEYLLNTCGADIEQRGQFEVQIPPNSIVDTKFVCQQCVRTIYGTAI